MAKTTGSGYTLIRGNFRTKVEKYKLACSNNRLKIFP